MGRSAFAADGPAAPAGIILELNPSFRGPSPHMFNLHWMVAPDADGYGWEIERRFPKSAGANNFVLWRAIPPGATYVGDFANVIDDLTPPGVLVCYRIRAADPSRVSGDWSTSACGDLAVIPPPVQMNISTTVLPTGVNVVWESLPGYDLGYWPQMARAHPDGLRDWLGIDIIRGQGRLSAYAPVGGVPARWCFRVFPLSSSGVGVSPSQETCLDYPGDSAVTPPPSPAVTPAPPPTGSGDVGQRESHIGRSVGFVLAVSGLALLSIARLSTRRRRRE